MFNKKVSNKLKKLNLKKEDYELIVSTCGNYICRHKAFGCDLNYYKLFNLSPQNSLHIFQDSKKESVTTMNPFMDAIVISVNYTTKLCQIHKFHPWAFTQVIMLNQMYDIRPNFDLYNVFRTDGTKVTKFEELRVGEEFIAISKQSFHGVTKNGYFSEDFPIHMILRWAKPYNVRIL